MLIVRRTVRFLYSSRKWCLAGLSLYLAIWYFHCLPAKLFNDPTATVLMASDGTLLGAKIASDGQWRFKASQAIPDKFKVCLLHFEDRTFYEHRGVSLRGIGRALMENIKHRKVVSGGSTISMQLIRIMRKNPRRTLREKVLEILMATRLEFRYSKDDILYFYASNAPFGNNVVGLEAASWRYFGRSPDKLSWAECATLAVLPNAPGLIYPGKNQARLLEKRNRLLRHLFDSGKLDRTSLQLALHEPLPVKPNSLPHLAPHLLVKCLKEGYQGNTLTSNIDPGIQKKAIELLYNHSLLMKQNKIFNGAVMITEVSTGKVIAYVGNTHWDDPEQSSEVDCIMAPRSTGSTLKPLLFAKCLEEGLITPAMLIPDIPSHFGGFSPKNFALQYDGAVSANKALSRSLNIPMVRLLNEYGVSKFHQNLKDMGLSTLNKPARHYGLSLILGGGEARLFELSAVYTYMAQHLRSRQIKKVSVLNDFPLVVQRKKECQEKFKMDAACIYSTFEAMLEVNRPDEEGNWKVYSSSKKIAWKTGTSFGFRDAWAIGITPDYVVAVWIGNADGEGRPGLTGVKAAAPLLFNVFAQLPSSTQWFMKPYGSMRKAFVCRESGHRAGIYCLVKDEILLPSACMESVVCPYHQLVHLSINRHYRVDSECESVDNMVHQKWFVLPPLIEKYYKVNHPDYRMLPAYKPGCHPTITDKNMVLIYPRPNSHVYVPVEIDGAIGRTVFEASHRNAAAKIYWHLDDVYLGETKDIHQMMLHPSVGKHEVLLVDEEGGMVKTNFQILGKVENHSP